MEAVTLYGASSPDVAQEYKDVAKALGKALSEEGLAVVSGGGRAGLMAAAIDGATEAGGKTIGVLPSFMIERGWNHPGLSETITVETMHERKARMASLSRAAIAMPGGCGTLEELLEIITWRQLGLYQGHVIILNTDGYYDPLIAMLERTLEQHFMNEDHRNLWHISTTVEDAVKEVLKPIVERPFSQKLSSKNQ